jgi:hypothetical protein
LCTPTSFIFHAALYSVFLAITDVADSPGHSSPGEAFVPVMWLFLMFVVAADAVVGGGRRRCCKIQIYDRIIVGRCDKMAAESVASEPHFAIQGIPRDSDAYVRALICPTADFDKAMNAAKTFVLADPTLIGFVLYDEAGAEVARWISSEEAQR